MLIERWPDPPVGCHATFRGIDLQAKPVFYKICTHGEFDIRPIYYSYKFAIKALKLLRIPYIPIKIYFSKKSKKLIFKSPFCRGKTPAAFCNIKSRLEKLPIITLTNMFLFTWLFNFHDSHDENFLITKNKGKERIYVIDFEDILYCPNRALINSNVLYDEYFQFHPEIEIACFQEKLNKVEIKITDFVRYTLNKIWGDIGYYTEIAFSEYTSRLQRLKDATIIGNLFHGI